MYSEWLLERKCNLTFDKFQNGSAQKVWQEKISPVVVLLINREKCPGHLPRKRRSSELTLIKPVEESACMQYVWIHSGRKVLSRYKLFKSQNWPLLKKVHAAVYCIHSGRNAKSILCIINKREVVKVSHVSHATDFAAQKKMNELRRRTVLCSKAAALTITIKIKSKDKAMYSSRNVVYKKPPVCCCYFVLLTMIIKHCCTVVQMHQKEWSGGGFLFNEKKPPTCLLSRSSHCNPDPKNLCKDIEKPCKNEERNSV